MGIFFSFYGFALLEHTSSPSMSISHTLTNFFRYSNHKYLALYIPETLKFQVHILQPSIRQDSHKGSQHFLGYYLQRRAPRDQLIPVHIQTLDQWGCVWPHPATRDVSSKSVLDQFLRGGLGPPYLSNAQTPPRSYLVDSPHRANRLCWVFFSVLHSASDVRRDEFKP